jgi:hypothetical protein
MQPISEPDWKILRRLQPIALERYCRSVLDEVTRVASETSRDSHAQYLKVFKLIEKSDETLGEAFDDPKRSTAFIQLGRMRTLGLVTDEEFASFSEHTQTMASLFQKG